ncbi:substrate-binding domain-containing protein [Brucella thiophenivorans]|uniref:Bacterial extracellular solute-binding family protein n=1 Tax=Brucella thiophenivorans TaxID=571255 RepID=A0A256G1L6_9HYPH|nr:substrate-binding domain-containing protein [Brucella thiophenivorans]OYR20900.1 bacterial extracellular solute-binding family protein [Brucella thiophenivorans]
MDIKSEIKNNLNVISSGAFYEVMEELIEPFQKNSGVHINLSSGSSIGESETSIPHRLSRGEKFDVVILAEKELEVLVSENLIDANVHAKLVFSHIGAVVPHGTTIPDMSTVDAAIDAMLNATKIGYSASMSGTHLSTEIFPKFAPDVYAKLVAKMEKVIGDRVAKRVADGAYDLGFQEISEIEPFTKGDNGVQLVIPIPKEWQQTNVFSIGVVNGSDKIPQAKELIAYLASPEAKGIINAEGLEQFTPKNAGVN